MCNIVKLPDAKKKKTEQVKENHIGDVEVISSLEQIPQLQFKFRFFRLDGKNILKIDSEVDKDFVEDFKAFCSDCKLTTASVIGNNILVKLIELFFDEEEFDEVIKELQKRK